ncbi:unnamed protein product [Somion occarium]|uniref:Reverse transcriptase domain-containing protein n=1 Tax=Somion occarium TaxID=3059160 RepID=A0ABP1D486_9APHY
MTSACNTSPMMLLTKPGTGVNGIPPHLHVVADLRERNANTHKLTSPLPDMEGILRRASRKPYWSLIDGKDAYEHIRVDSDHIEHTAMTTPDGNMVSLVMQQGDCNAVATYQTLMNYIFGEYIGVFMDVYLDDIVIYSDTLDDHIQHVKLVIDALQKEHLYLSVTKLNFLPKEMKILGRIIDDQGIRMDPNKVDSVLNWKVPTSKELLQGFLGSVGYLADDIATVRIPMGILTSLTGADACFKWEFTHQRAFEEVKHLIHEHREHHRVPLDYSPGAPRIWLVTDGSLGGIAGVICQGDSWRAGRVAAFYSAKLSSAQMNYPVHEIEMLAGVESMLRHCEILIGCLFTWVTDHKGLTHVLKQKNLSGQQARWLEKISEFDFTIEYVPGIDNILANALSCIYSNDRPGTVRAASEYTTFDETSLQPTFLESLSISVPVYVGIEAQAVQPHLSHHGAHARMITAPSRIPTTITPQPVLVRAAHKQARRNPSSPASVASDGISRPARECRVKSPLLAAETGWPETSKEFAKRIKRVMLHVNREQRQEGESAGASWNTGLDDDSNADSPAPPSFPTIVGDGNEELEGVPITSQSTEGLLIVEESQFLEHISSSFDGLDLERVL